MFKICIPHWGLCVIPTFRFDMRDNNHVKIASSMVREKVSGQEQSIGSSSRLVLVPVRALRRASQLHEPRSSHSACSLRPCSLIPKSGALRY